MKWYTFDKSKGSKQKRPPIGRWVLVRLASFDKAMGMPDPVVAGYRKDAAGDKQCPYFIVPGAYNGEPYAWCDCLPDYFDFGPEIERPKQMYRDIFCTECLTMKQWLVNTEGLTECLCSCGYQFTSEWGKGSILIDTKEGAA